MKDRAQVLAQCRVVAHLALNLADLYVDYAKLFEQPSSADDLIDQVGERTASFMEKLGDMLNATDAVSEDDAWVNPIFEAAHRLWPQEPPK